MLAWECIHIEADGLAIFRQKNETFAAFGNGFVEGKWYILEGDTLQLADKVERYNAAHPRQPKKGDTYDHCH